MTITRLDIEDPRILAWVTTVPHLGGGWPKVSYGSGFFLWLKNQFLMVEDYSYEGEDFRDDLELALLEGEEWDERGKERHYQLMFLVFVFYFIFTL